MIFGIPDRLATIELPFNPGNIRSERRSLSDMQHALRSMIRACCGRLPHHFRLVTAGSHYQSRAGAQAAYLGHLAPVMLDGSPVHPVAATGAGSAA